MGNKQTVTREELSSNFQALSEQLNNNKNNEIKEWEQKYKKLSLEYELLQKQYQLFKKESEIKNGGIEQRGISPSKISLLAINDYVENEIMNTEANSKWILDAVEKRAYITMYKTLLEGLQQVSNTTTLGIFNHKITIHIEPLEKYI